MNIIQETRQNLTDSMRHYMAMRLLFRSSVLSTPPAKLADSLPGQAANSVKH